VRQSPPGFLHADLQSRLIVTLVSIFVGALAATNWLSRWSESRKLEWTTKPLVTGGLIVIALAVDPASSVQRTWFVVALIFCLIGDIALMLPNERFIAGLSAFLVGHGAFAVGFIARAESADVWAIGVVAIVTGVCLTLTARRTLAALSARSSRLLKPVVAYAAVILTMTVTSLAGGTLAPIAAATFAASDSILADNKFVASSRAKSVAVMVSYHAALALLIVSLG